jgi:PKD repeat protein
VTGADGVARFVVTSPQPEIVTANNQVLVFVTRVGNDDRDFSSRSVAVGILGPSNATYPTPDFAIVPESPVVDVAVVFDASATTDEGVPCLDRCTYSWSFGDGSTGGGRVASHAYGAKGSYAVTLTVTDDLGSTGTVTRAVEVTEAEEEEEEE